jgi:hypothetical protein
VHVFSVHGHYCDSDWQVGVFPLTGIVVLGSVVSVAVGQAIVKMVRWEQVKSQK